MSRKLVVLCCILAIAAVLCVGSAPGSTEELTRVKMPNDVGIELLGKSLLYSFYYQRTVLPFLGLEAGISALGGGDDEDNATIVFFPIGAKVYIIPKNGSLYATGGITVVTANVESGPFEDDESGTYPWLGLGFEFRSETGFLFRGTAYALLGGGFFIWPGLTVGYAF